MSREVKIISLDPSLNNTGIAVCRVIIPTFEIRVDHLFLADTEARAGKTVRKNSDDLRRAEEIVTAIAKLGEGAIFAIGEVPTGSQSARGMFSNGICVGVMACLKVLNLPLIQVQPTDTKLASVGSKTATKDQIIDWAYEKYPQANWIRHGSSKRASKLTDANEHLADAVAIAHAGIQTPEFRSAASMLLGMMKHELV